MENHFRQKFMDETVAKLKQKLPDEQAKKLVKDLEIYLKSREKKITKQEATIKLISDQLKGEQENTSALLSEISQSAEAFQQICSQKEGLQKDLNMQSTNLIEVIKEKSQLVKMWQDNEKSSQFEL